MDGKQWMPVVYGSLGTNDDECTVEVNGPKMTVREEGEPVVTVSLPAYLRLCHLVDAPPPAPAAWGPPMAQADAEGQWAFEGDTPDELNVHWFVKLYYAEYTDGGDLELFAEPNHADGGYFAGEMIGTWRKLLVDPWEVQP
jgi:hypothetical protein